jgi:hypothetical protein
MKPIVFLLILSLIVIGGYIYYTQNDKKDSVITPPTPTQTSVPTEAPIIGECGSGKPIYDKNGILINCECIEGTAGDKCEYTKINSCNNGGNPSYNKDKNKVSCSCFSGKLGDYCCDEKDPIYLNRNRCTDDAECTINGWKITQKKCSDIKTTYKNDPNCTYLCQNGNISNLRCNSYMNGNNAVVSCDSNLDYGDPFLEALYYPPNENDDPLDPNNVLNNWKNLNQNFWEVLKTDRDLSKIISGDRNSARAKGNYGAFFKTYQFPDAPSSDDPNMITNNDLMNVINDIFNGNSNFAFDNFGNITIYINNIKKIFKNPAFPNKENTLDINSYKLTTKNLNGVLSDIQLCNQMRGGWDDSTNKCWQYYPDADRISSYQGLSNSIQLRLNNKNFITSSNKKWILYNKTQNPSDPTYVLLYNPIHSTNYKNYYTTSPSTDSRRMQDTLLQKYGEISAEKGTYGVSPRNYGDDSAYCFGGYNNDKGYMFPDCVGYNSNNSGAKKYFINPVNMTDSMLKLYNQFSGQCSCSGPSCFSNNEIINNADKDPTGKIDNPLNDSFIDTFRGDMKNYVFKKDCTQSINICNIDINTANALNMNQSNIASNCS